MFFIYVYPAVSFLFCSVIYQRKVEKSWLLERPSRMCHHLLSTYFLVIRPVFSIITTVIPFGFSILLYFLLSFFFLFSFHHFNRFVTWISLEIRRVKLVLQVDEYQFYDYVLLRLQSHFFFFCGVEETMWLSMIVCVYSFFLCQEKINHISLSCRRIDLFVTWKMRHCYL